MIYVFTILGIVAGALIGYFVARSGKAEECAAMMSRRDVLQAQLDSLQSAYDSYKEQAERSMREAEGKHAGEVGTLKSDHEARMAEQRGQYESSLRMAKADAEKQRDEMQEHYRRQLVELREQYESSLRMVKADAEKQKEEMQGHYRQQLAEFHSQQKEQMEQQSHLIREQINSASEEILKKRSDELSSSNKEQLNSILNPLRENLRQMRETVEKSDREHTTSMERLDASIKANLRQAQEVGERADKLAQALTSENKVQGNFGELRLRTLLENMGLEEGVQFEEQVVMRDRQGGVLTGEDGHRMIPDVILHFPDNRDVIIDSKMSLKAFEDYYNATEQAGKDEALRRHIASVRKHVGELAHKKYGSYVNGGANKLDFVVMYIYSESALQLALANEPTLWQEAYDQGVIVSGSQNLYMMLRVLEMTWRQTRQAENQDKIMDAANELVNRVQMFYERFSNVGEQLDKTQKAFDELRKTTAPTGKSIVTAANKLIKFGAKENPKRKLRLPKGDEGEEVAAMLEDNDD